jgi:membrane protease YdiL (CAAX protease family)
VSTWKNVKSRIIAFIVGIIFTPFGLVMLYYDFFGKKDQWYSDTSYYSWAIFFIGVASFLIAFERKKKTPDHGSKVPGKSQDEKS